MSVGFIYLIRNLITNKVYVGLTEKTVAKRWACHKSYAAKPPKRSGRGYIHSAIHKYGVENFTIEVIEEVSLDNLSLAEKKWIAHYDSTNPTRGYNLTTGGEKPIFTEAVRKKMSDAKIGKYLGENNPTFGRVVTKEERERSRQVATGNTYHLGKPHTEESKRKISEALSGRKQSAEERARRSASIRRGEDSPLYGIPLSEETRLKMSAAKMGTIISSEQRKAVGDFHRGRKRKPETGARISAALTGRSTGPQSPEVVEKRRLSMLATLAEQRANGTLAKRPSGEDHGMFGKEHTTETKDKMKAAKASVESRAEISERKKKWWADNPELAEAARKKMSESGKNRKPPTEEARAAMKAAGIARWARIKAERLLKAA